jgi:glycine/D-amino acid oxidase-like deaminating enzyme
MRLRYPDPYFELNKNGMISCYQLANAVRDGTWLHATGNVEIATGEDATSQLRADVSAMLQQGYAVYLLDATNVGEIEPTLRLPPESVVALYPEEGWIDGPHMVGSVIEEYHSAGGRVIESDGVAGFGMAGERVATATLRSGAVVEAGAFVLAVGVNTMELAACAGVHVPLVPRSSPQVAGLLVRCRWDGAHDGLRHIAHFGDFAIRPDGRGQTLSVDTRSSTAITLDTPPETLRRVADSLLTKMREALPFLDGARVSSTLTGHRAIPLDRVSVVGWVPGIGNLYVLVTHSGITLAALFARLAAIEITKGTAQTMLEPYRPGRFAATVRSVNL